MNPVKPPRTVRPVFVLALVVVLVVIFGMSAVVTVSGRTEVSDLALLAVGLAMMLIGLRMVASSRGHKRPPARPKAREKETTPVGLSGK